LIDARLAPRQVATAPELGDLLRAPPDVTAPMPRPDEKALKAAAAASPAEPDLLVVATTQGGAVQIKGKPPRIVDAATVASLPLARDVLEGARPRPGFANLDGAVYRIAAAAMPASTGAVVVGTLVDDSL